MRDSASAGQRSRPAPAHPETPTLPASSLHSTGSGITRMLEGVYAAVARATTADWLLLAAGLLLMLYVVGTWRYDFFKRRGVASTVPKTPFLGNTLKAFIGLSPFPDLVKDLYNQGKGHGVFGFFEFRRPIFMMRHPDVIKVVTVKEFDHFMNHRSVASEKSDPIFSQNLFNLKDQRWKDMRTTLSPAFTTSKIKAMFPLIAACTSQTAQHLRQEQEALIKSGKKGPLEVDMKDLFSRLANDVIATVAFGVGCDSQKEPKNEFYFMGKEMTTFTFVRTMIFFFYLVIPKVAEALGLRVLSKKATNYFDSLVHNTIRERQQKGIFRPDMLQLLMQAREGQLKAEANEEHETDKFDSKFKLSNDDITAQAVIFFFAGFETVSTALCFTAYALSRHPDAQQRLQEEVDAMMQETGGKPTYEAIQGMKYLDAVISEALRMYPPVVAVDRMCREDVVLPATDSSPAVHIRKGDITWVPIYALHHDPELWEEPEKFDPDRFSDDNKHRVKPFSYAPFGLGPRLCIGQRFALLEVKMALVNLIANFDIHPSPKTKEPLQFEKGFNMMIRGGFWNKLVPRNV